MTRVARRIRHAALARPGSFDPALAAQEAAMRARTARKIRVELRRGATVQLSTPRWSRPEPFLEDLALELAVGEPGIGCRTVSFRRARGRSEPESWQIALDVFGQLGQPRWVSGPPVAVADARGFRLRLAQILAEAESNLRAPVALLATGVDDLPVRVIEDIAAVWAAHVAGSGEGRRSRLLVAGISPLVVRFPGAVTLELRDYGEDEAVTALLGSTRFPHRAVRTLARFTGGVPGLVEVFAEHIAQGRTPTLRPDALLSELGVLADELRGAVDIACADGQLADRLQRLLPGEALPEEPALDEPLLSAGLLRRARGGPSPLVELRSPAIAALVA